MAFTLGRDESEDTLRGVVQSLLLSDGWVNVRDNLGNSLKQFKPEECRKGLPPPLAQQLILDIIGGELRELWGLENEYDVSVLREPYLPAKRRFELSKSISTQMQNRILALLSQEDGKMLSEQYGRQLTLILDTLLTYKKQSIQKASSGKLYSVQGTAPRLPVKNRRRETPRRMATACPPTKPLSGNCHLLLEGRLQAPGAAWPSHLLPVCPPQRAVVGYRRPPPHRRRRPAACLTRKS